MEARLRAVEDRLEIQALAAKFSGAVNERDEAAFARLWATEKTVWEVGPHLQSRAEEIDEVVSGGSNLAHAKVPRPSRRFQSIMQSRGLKLYSIRIRGHLGATSLAAFPQMVPQQQDKDCVLTGVLPDNSALFGVLAEIEALGLELIEIRRLVPKPESPNAQQER